MKFALMTLSILIAECMGDWTENDVKGYLYLADRAATVRKAYDIMREELHLGEFLPEIDQ